MYSEFIEYITPTLGTALGTIITALCGYLIVYINKKKAALQEEINNKETDKYLDMISQTIEDCVRATNQTYVEALKKQNAFTKEAQEIAFQMTISNIYLILTEDCMEFLNTITDDLNSYLTNKIEAQVNWEK